MDADLLPELGRDGLLGLSLPLGSAPLPRLALQLLLALELVAGIVVALVFG